MVIKGEARFKAPAALSSATYSYIILQYSFDEISIHLKNEAGANTAYIIPIKKAAGWAIKVNKASISTEDGTAESLLNFYSRFPGSEFVRGTIDKLIFQNPKADRLKA